MVESFVGLPGHGKTYHMTKKAFFLAKYKKKVVYSNYKIDFPGIETHYFKSLNDILNVNNALILIDEAGIYLPSQAWQSIPFEFICKLRQHRHDGVDLWYTAQDAQDVATYLRRITQLEHSFNKMWKFVISRCINPRTKAKYGFDITFLTKKYFAMYDTNETVEIGDYLQDAIVQQHLKKSRMK